MIQDETSCSFLSDPDLCCPQHKGVFLPMGLKGLKEFTSISPFQHFCLPQTFNPFPENKF